MKLWCILILFRHGEKSAAVISAVANNHECGVGLAFNAKLGGKFCVGVDLFLGIPLSSSLATPAKSQLAMFQPYVVFNFSTLIFNYLSLLVAQPSPSLQCCESTVSYTVNHFHQSFISGYSF